MSQVQGEQEISQQLRRFQVVGAIDYISDPGEFSRQVAKLLNWDQSFAIEFKDS